MEGVLVRNQKTLPLCFSFAAAAMLDAYLKVNYKRKFPPSSSFAGAILASKEYEVPFETTFTQGGYLCYSMDSMIRKGFCSEKKTEFLFESILNRTSQINNIDKLAEVIEQVCEKGYAKLKVSCKEIYRVKVGYRTGTDLLSEVDKEFRKGKLALPIGIKYCAGLVMQGRDFKGTYSEYKDNLLWKPDCFVHYSVIIGTRFIKEKEYLIRDSFGPDCDSRNLHKDWECDNGSFWIPEKSLINNILAVDVLE